VDTFHITSLSHFTHQVKRLGTFVSPSFGFSVLLIFRNARNPTISGGV
jgi:hypothetical protein